MKDLEDLSVTDEYAEVVKKALLVNSDCVTGLYLHQYDAICALAKGCDVLLITPCGSGQISIPKIWAYLEICQIALLFNLELLISPHPSPLSAKFTEFTWILVWKASFR